MIEHRTIDREIARGERFSFGENWSRFLRVLSGERIAAAERSLKEMLNVTDLAGKSFLDIGSGSGLYSLAARRLGARIHSFDYDPRSVACTHELRSRFFPCDPEWVVEEGNVLDRTYVESLGTFDIVYSWGVLHHTNAMYQALENARVPVASGGRLFIAIYNDQGWRSRSWVKVKRIYLSGRIGRGAVEAVFIPYWVATGLAADLINGRDPVARYRQHKGSRGMSVARDWADWLGGLPFEVARPEQIFSFYADRGFTLERMTTAGGGLACNQFVFVRNHSSTADPAA